MIYVLNRLVILCLQAKSNLERHNHLSLQDRLVIERILLKSTQKTLMVLYV